MAVSKVLCVGRLYCDLVFTGLPRLPTLGTEIFSEGLSVHPGGGAYITAAHLAALGHPTCLGVMLPPSPYLALVQAQIEGAGLDLALSGALPTGADPQVTVALVQDGERAFLSRRSGPAFPDIGRDEIRRKGVQHLHIGELASAIEQPDLIAKARALGLTVSLDCGWDDDFSEDDIAALVGAVDVFLPNAAEAARLDQMGLTERLGALTVIKRGDRGAVAIKDGARVAAPTHPVRALDTTGAGDAFNAGFLSAWLNGAPLASCLVRGNALGGQAVRQRGGFNAPAPDPAAGSTPLPASTEAARS